MQKQLYANIDYDGQAIVNVSMDTNKTNKR